MKHDRTKRRYISMPWCFGLRRWAARNFDDCCFQHDIAYEHQICTRKDADSHLLELMKGHINLKAGGKFWYYVFAYSTYGMVRAFGWMRWNQSKKLLKRKI